MSPVFFFSITKTPRVSLAERTLKYTSILKKGTLQSSTFRFCPILTTRLRFLLDVFDVKKTSEAGLSPGVRTGGFPILTVCSWDLRFGRRLIEPTTLPKN